MGSGPRDETGSSEARVRFKQKRNLKFYEGQPLLANVVELS